MEEMMNIQKWWNLPVLVDGIVLLLVCPPYAGLNNSLLGY
jgi:hypothetical protein